MEQEKLVREIIEKPDKVEIYLTKKQAFDLGWSLAGNDQHEAHLPFEDIRWDYKFMKNLFNKTSTNLSHTQYPETKLIEKIIIKSESSCLIQLKEKMKTNFKENLFVYLFNLGVHMRIGGNPSLLDIPFSTNKNDSQWNLTIMDLIDLNNSIDRTICLTSVLK